MTPTGDLRLPTVTEPEEQARPAGASTVLDARDISVSFGGVRAVRDVSLTLARDEILGIVGPNGSGKSTFLNAITGVVRARGSLVVSGAPARLGRPAAARRAGIARVFQQPQVFSALSCLENVAVGDADRRLTGGVGALVLRPLMARHERARWERAQAALDGVGLGALAQASAGDVTYGQQRLLELARAVVSGAPVILLDEPSAGLNDAETERLKELLRGLRDQGRSLVIVDHKIDFIDALCDRVAVFELGQLVAVAPPAVIWTNPRVVDAYLGVVHDA